MRANSAFRVFFILYCIEAGVFLLLAPWCAAWERAAFSVSGAALRGLLLDPLVRGALSGFGLVHLVWCAHDLVELLTFLKSRAGSQL